MTLRFAESRSRHGSLTRTCVQIRFVLTAQESTSDFVTTSSDAFDTWIEAWPLDDDGAELEVGPLYDEWRKRASVLLLGRAKENISNYRKAIVAYHESWALYHRNMCSKSALDEIGETRDELQRQFEDVREWAAQFKPGWENEIIKQANLILNRELEKESRELNEAARKKHEEERRLYEQKYKEMMGGGGKQSQQHGHSHNGVPCKGHGPPPQQEHGHSHNGVPCEGHGPPQESKKRVRASDVRRRANKGNVKGGSAVQKGFLG